MKLALDDDIASTRLIEILRKAGHDVQSPAEGGIAGAADALHFTEAIQDYRVQISANARDFKLLHDLIMAAGGNHPGLLLVPFDNDPTRDLTARGIATAISRLESAGVPIRDQLHILNHRRN